MKINPVPGYPGYFASSDGRIKGPSGKWLSPFPDHRGYLRFNVSMSGGKIKQIAVHAAVCMAFHGERPHGMLVAHSDGDHTNNKSTNLRWATYKDNEKDKREHGRVLEGSRHHQAKLSEDDVLSIRDRLLTGEKGSVLASAYGVTQTTISYIKQRKTWRHI